MIFLDDAATWATLDALDRLVKFLVKCGVKGVGGCGGCEREVEGGLGVRIRGVRVGEGLLAVKHDVTFLIIELERTSQN